MRSRIVGAVIAASILIGGYAVVSGGGGGGGANWAGTFDCYGSTPNCVGLTPATCTTTIAATSLQTALNSASGGAVICVTAGSTGNISLTSQSYSSLVTVQPASSAAVTVGSVTLNAVANLKFTGAGNADGSAATMSMGFTAIDTSSGCSTNVTFDHITETGGVLIQPKYSCSHGLGLLWDHDRFDDLPHALYDGRFSVNALGTGPGTTVGITISNSHFGGWGQAGSPVDCSDGVFLGGDVHGVVIGPGNEFTGIDETSSCGSLGYHVDPIQFFGGTASTVTGNYFHDNGSGSGGVMSADGDDGYTIKNNVFVQQVGGYAHLIVADGCTGCTVTHNVILNADTEAGTDNGGTDHTTDIIFKDNVGGIGTETASDAYVASYDLSCGGCTGSNLIAGSPVFVSSPSSGYYHYQLDSSSPGYQAGSTGTSVGIDQAAG